MSKESPFKALRWMATGAAVLAAGAFLGSAAGRRKQRAGETGIAPETLEDLSDRPVARSVLAESLAAARRLEKLSGVVERLEARVQSIEGAAPVDRIEAIWQKVLQVEQRLEQVQAERAKLPALDAVLAQAESRLVPRIHGLETRVDDHHTAIQQLQTQAAQTEANLQKMIAAVEKLTEQISRAFPSGGMRIEPKKEGEPAEEEKPGSLRWKSLALAGAITLGLAGSWGAGDRPTPPQHPQAVAAPAPDQIDTAIESLTHLVEEQPAHADWKYELGRLYTLKGDWSKAARWYKAVLQDDPHEPRALYGLVSAQARS